MRTKLCLAACLILALALAGCARGMSQSQARGRCLTMAAPSNGDGFDLSCPARNEVCGAFLPGEGMESLTREQCMAQCAKTELEQERLHLVDGCQWLIQQASILCDRYCRSKPAQ